MVDKNASEVLSPVLQKQEKDIATVERTEDDMSWIELRFVGDDGNGSFADHSTISNAPPESISLDSLTIDDAITLSNDGELNDTPTAVEAPKPSEEETKSPSRRRPKKTQNHRKIKSFNDKLLINSEGTVKKKKKKEKTIKKTKGGDSGESPVKSKRKQKKRTSGKQQSDDGAGESLLGGNASANDQSFVLNQPSAPSPSPKRRGLRSLSPVRIRNPLRGGAGQRSGKGVGVLGRAMDLKDQLALSDHVPRDKKGIMGTALYSRFDDDGSDLDDDELFTSESRSAPLSAG